MHDAEQIWKGERDQSVINTRSLGQMWQSAYRLFGISQSGMKPDGPLHPGNVMQRGSFLRQIGAPPDLDVRKNVYSTRHVMLWHEQGPGHHRNADHYRVNRLRYVIQV